MLGALSMGPRKSLRWLSLLVFMLVLKPEPWAAAADENDELVPRLGETTVEFEARVKGLPRPPSSDSVTLVADSLGHFFVEPIVNGTRLRMMVDTGASLVVLSRDDARLIGINPAPADFRIRVSTANGPVLVAPIMLREVTVGALAVRDVPGAVFPDNTLQTGLLGMSFLSKLSHFEVAGGRLVLKR
jgi:aspartyl protease family protein